MNLFHRKVIEDPTHEGCGLGSETVLHVLCQCTKAREVWTHCNLSHTIEGQGEFTDILWRSGMNPNNGSNLLDIILMIAWCIWKNKNEVRHGGRKHTAAEMFETAIRLLDEYNAAQEVPVQHREDQPA